MLSPEEELQERIDASLNMHRESVVWFLRRGLEGCAEVQRGMMETRLEREVEKSKSALYKTKGAVAGAGPGLENGWENGWEGANGGSGHQRGKSVGGGRDGWRGADGVEVEEREKEKKKIENELSPEQLQLFAQENNEMLKHYEDTLDQVRFVGNRVQFECESVLNLLQDCRALDDRDIRATNYVGTESYSTVGTNRRPCGGRGEYRAKCSGRKQAAEAGDREMATRKVRLSCDGRPVRLPSHMGPDILTSPVATGAGKINVLLDSSETYRQNLG